MNAKIFKKYDSVLGECPIWDASSNYLYWIDIIGKLIHRLDWSDKSITSRILPFEIGAVALTDNPDLLIVAHGISFSVFNWQTESLELLTTTADDPKWVRFNDGKCDTRGRFICGTLDLADEMTRVQGLDIDIPEGTPFGKLYTYSTGDDSPIMLERDVITSNGLGWNDTETTFFFADSSRGTVSKYNYDIRTGLTSNQNVIFTVPTEWGTPDGLTLDEDGNLWVALWDGWAVIKLSPTGELLEKIEVPAKRPTSCAFVGQNLDYLMITSASMVGCIENDDDSELGGSLFYIKTDCKGTISNKFKL